METVGSRGLNGIQRARKLTACVTARARQLALQCVLHCTQYFGNVLLKTHSRHQDLRVASFLLVPSVAFLSATCDTENPDDRNEHPQQFDRNRPRA